MPDKERLEREGMRYLYWFFLLCPCHLPLTVAILLSVFGGTALGVVLREHIYVASFLIIVVWALGTARGIVLLRRAKAMARPAVA